MFMCEVDGRVGACVSACVHAYVCFIWIHQLYFVRLKWDRHMFPYFSITCIWIPEFLMSFIRHGKTMLVIDMIRSASTFLAKQINFFCFFKVFHMWSVIYCMSFHLYQPFKWGIITALGPVCTRKQIFCLVKMTEWFKRCGLSRLGE